MRVTPPLKASGVYELRDPWAADPSTIYRCEAVRTIPEIREAGIDPYTAYYEPFARTKEEFDADVAEGVAIVTLLSDKRETINVPDTYIVKFPFEVLVPYNRVVLSVNLGVLPDALPLDLLLERVAGVCSDVIGADADVKMNSAPYTGAITEDEHQRLTTAREAAINDRTTDRAKLLAAEKTIETQAALIRKYEQAGLNP